MSKKIGQLIKELRLEKKMSVEELANKIGKSRATVYRYENNEIEDLPYTVLNPIAEALGTTPAYLLGWSDEHGKINGLKKKNSMTFSFGEDIDFVKMDQFRLYSSGIFETYKENLNLYYKWYNNIISNLNNHTEYIKQSINYYSKMFVPFSSMDMQYYIPMVKEYLDNLYTLIDELEELNKYLNELLYNHDNGLEIPTIDTVEEKRKYLSEYQRDYDFSELTDDEIEKFFDKFIVISKQENEKFKTALGLNDTDSNLEFL